MTQLKRCHWATSPAMNAYHDTEWGVPTHDDRRHFEFVILEGAQAGLSWKTILDKREGYRKNFCDFDPAKVAKLTPAKLEKILLDPGIVRNRAKVMAAVSNAKAFLQIQKDFGSFDKFLWDFVGGKPIVNKWRDMKQLPPRSDVSDAVAAALKKRGFKFAGSTIMYAHLQACGLINDHLTSCFRYRQV
ncbi:MAG TPA: DNA-3-methyladenine glycosylase I [Kofleriaceae bacterium]|jgi:DNA-3-methyladenine glycosylase I|nr:DNA-3-methyladenine glycosylase I [Kofleriaceae bacterium]